MGRSLATALMVSLEGARCEIAEDVEESVEDEAPGGTSSFRNLLDAKCARLMMSIISSRKKKSSRVDGFGVYRLKSVVDVVRMIFNFETNPCHIKDSQ